MIPHAGKGAMKIVIIGAGSRTFGLRTVADVLASPEMQEIAPELVLVDIDRACPKTARFGNVSVLGFEVHWKGEYFPDYSRSVGVFSGFAPIFGTPILLRGYRSVFGLVQAALASCAWISSRLWAAIRASFHRLCARMHHSIRVRRFLNPLLLRGLPR